MVCEVFEEALPDIFIPFYAQLVLTAVTGKFEITNEMVHDAWAMATVFKTDFDYHKSLLPYANLSKDIQDLDTIYTEKLNNIVNHLTALDNIARG